MPTSNIIFQYSFENKLEKDENSTKEREKHLIVGMRSPSPLTSHLSLLTKHPKSDINADEIDLLLMILCSLNTCGLTYKTFNNWILHEFAIFLKWNKLSENLTFFLYEPLYPYQLVKIFFRIKIAIILIEPWECHKKTTNKTLHKFTCYFPSSLRSSKGLLSYWRLNICLSTTFCPQLF